ncbi:MAG: hypothetical protein IJR47_02645, partial [Clostridia bacterium]|nr:hypothetical protein [Clostridia bacterium]
PSAPAAPAVESEKRDVLSEIFGSGRKEAADNSAEAAKRAEDAVAGARESASVPPASWISDLLKKEKNK